MDHIADIVLVVALGPDFDDDWETLEMRVNDGAAQREHAEQKCACHVTSDRRCLVAHIEDHFCDSYYPSFCEELLVTERPLPVGRPIEIRGSLEGGYCGWEYPEWDERFNVDCVTVLPKRETLDALSTKGR